VSVNAATQPAPRTLWRDDLVATLTGGLLILGLFLDGWNHLNLQNGAAGEFLTPWHGLLYAGFNACAIWAITRNTRLRAMMFKRPGKAGSGVGVARSAPQFNSGHVALLGLGLAGAGVIGDAVARAAGVVSDSGAMQPPFDFLLFTGAGLIFAVALRAIGVQVESFGKRVALPAVVGIGAAAAVVFAFGGPAATKSVDKVVKTIAAQPSVVQSAPRTAPAVRHTRHAAARVHHRAAASTHAHRASSSHHSATRAVSASAGATATHTHHASSSHHATRTVVVHRRASAAPHRRSAARPAPHRTSSKSKGRFTQVAVPDVPSDAPAKAPAPASSNSSGSSSSAPAATSPAASPTAAPTPTSTPTASNPPATPPTAAKHGGSGPG
jgi:hypothetical protein